MSHEHILRKAILICQTSALAEGLTDSEILSAILHVHDMLGGGNTVHEEDKSESPARDYLLFEA